MPYSFDDVTEEEALLQGAQRGMRPVGADLVDEFLESKKPRARVAFKDAKERDRIVNSAAGYVRLRHKDKVWLRKEGGKDGTSLILINLDEATGAEKDAYDQRPRGRASGDA